MTRWRTCNNRRRRSRSHWNYLGIFRRYAVFVRGCEARLVECDLRHYGVHITRDGKRVDPQDFYTEPCQ